MRLQPDCQRCLDCLLEEVIGPMLLPVSIEKVAAKVAAKAIATATSGVAQ